MLCRGYAAELPTRCFAPAAGQANVYVYALIDFLSREQKPLCAFAPACATVAMAKVPAGETKTERKQRQTKEYTEWQKQLCALGDVLVNEDEVCRCELCHKVYDVNLSATEAWKSHRSRCWVVLEKNFLDVFASKVQRRSGGELWECVTCGKCVDIYDANADVVWKTHTETNAHARRPYAEERLATPVPFVKEPAHQDNYAGRPDEDTDKAIYGIGARILFRQSLSDHVRAEQLKGRSRADVKRSEEARAAVLMTREPQASWKHVGLGYGACSNERPPNSQHGCHTRPWERRSRSTSSSQRRSRSRQATQRTSRHVRSSTSSSERRSRSRQATQRTRGKAMRCRSRTPEHQADRSATSQLFIKFDLLAQLRRAGHISNKEYSKKKHRLIAAI